MMHKMMERKQILSQVPIAQSITRFYYSYLPINSTVNQMTFVILNCKLVTHNLVWLVVNRKNSFFLEGSIIYACRFSL
uniref:Uncharacterized protein n=2 Tax=Cucumis melo TaxID=3656 RepID=A0A9I9CCI9_CUCME